MSGKRAKRERKEKKVDNDLVSIVILNYNGEDILSSCVASVVDNTDVPFEIILVDNNSTDNSRNQIVQMESLQKEIKSDYFRRIKTVLLNENIGFAAGNNKGFEVATGKYICILNNDIVVPEGWLSPMVSFLKKEKSYGAVGPRSNYSGGYQLVRPDTDEKLDFNDFDDFFNYMEKFKDPNKQFLRVSVLMGWCILLSRELCNKIGGFDENFGLGWWEDNDLSTKIIAEGLDLAVAHNVILYHKGGHTFKKENVNTNYWNMRNHQYYVSKWCPKYNSYKYPVDTVPTGNMNVCICIDDARMLTTEVKNILNMCKSLETYNVTISLVSSSYSRVVADKFVDLGVSISNTIENREYDLFIVSGSSIMDRVLQVATTRGIPIAVYMHDNRSESIPTADTIKYADVIMVPSRECYTMLVSSVGVDPEKVRLMPMFVYVDPNVMMPRSQNTTVVLHYDLTQEVIPFIAANFAVFEKIVIPLRIEIVGEGDVAAIIPMIARLESRTPHKVYMLGSVHDIHNRVYRTADVVVSTEMPVIESLMCDTVTIASATSGYDGIITEDNYMGMMLKNYSGRSSGDSWEEETFKKDLLDAFSRKPMGIKPLIKLHQDGLKLYSIINETIYLHAIRNVREYVVNL